MLKSNAIVAALLLVHLCGVTWASPDKIIPVGPGAKDRCPVCGMFVAPYPTWVAALKLTDGKVEYFDGPRDMFLRYFALGGKSSGAEVFVTDYYAAKLIPASGAFFVTGSDVIGPMGAELVPLGSADEAAGFMKDHDGKRVYAFGEVVEDTLKPQD